MRKEENVHSRISSILGTLIITCAAVLASAHESWSDTIYVASNGDDAGAGAAQAPLRTVQAGINMAKPGDTVLVKAGMYRERLTFPRDGEAGKPITLAGEADWKPEPRVILNGRPVNVLVHTVIDGGTIVTGWERVAGAGNVHRLAYTGPQPYNLTWNNKYILRIRDEFMAPDGMTILREGPAGWDTFEGALYRSWDGVEAMWGTQNGYLYLGFGDSAIDPAKQEITTTPGSGEGGAAITIDGRKFIIVRGLTVRNGYNPVLVRNKSSDCVIENNTLIGGHECVMITGGSSRIVVRKNEMTLGYVHELAPDDPRHYFIWAAFKETSDWDRVGVEVEDVGSDNEVAENHIYENFDGVENQRAGVRLTVRNNLIEKMADDGLEPDGEETEARWHDNTVRECGQAFRHKGIIGPGPMYIYRNVFYSKAASGHGGTLGLYFFCGTATPVYIYHNTFATGLGLVLNNYRVRMGLPNVWVVNNIFSCARIFEAYDPRMWVNKPKSHFEYNYCGGDLSAPLDWWGKTNKVVANGQLWKAGAEPDYQLSATSAAREMGIDLSKPWTLDGIEHPALPGMEAGYFTGTRPDAGARQYHPPAEKTGP